MNRLGIILCLALLTGGAQAETWLIENVHLVDIDGDRVTRPVAVVVHDGFIRRVIEDSELPDNTRRVDGGGGYLMPGLAEMHAHVPPQDDRQLTEDVLILFLAHGVTTIRGMLGQPHHLPLKRELAEGALPGPRLITSGPSFHANSVRSAEQAADMVRVQAEAGYDFLKLHPGLWPEAFQAIVDTARGLDIAYAGHVSVAVGVERALNARQATIDHLDGYAQVLVPKDHALHGTDPGFFGINLAPALDTGLIESWARRTAEAGVWNVPTQVLIEHIAGAESAEALNQREIMRYVPDTTRQQWVQAINQLRGTRDEAALARFVEVRRALIAALHAAGAGLLLGADAPQIMNIPGYSAHQELAIYVEAGLSPAQALATGTTAVARFLNEPAHGCLQAGCVADLMLLDANPLEDIANTRGIRGVARAGTWYDRDTLDAALEAVAERARESGD